MKISLQKLKQSRDNSISFDELVDVSDLADLENDIRSIEPVHVQGSAKLDGSEIICELTVQGEMILPCARTLVDVPYSFDFRMEESFTTRDYPENEDVHTVNVEVLDLVPYIKENVILEIPYRVFAEKEILEANTIEQGEGWTLITEEERSTKIDPRLEKLKALLDDNNNDSL